MSGFDLHKLAPAGSTGNATHDAVYASGAYENLIAEFAATGGAGTLSWKLQGSLNSTDGVDGDWYDLAYITDSSDTMAVSARTVSAVGRQVSFITRPFLWVRLVVSGNSGLTYTADLHVNRGI